MVSLLHRGFISNHYVFLPSLVVELIWIISSSQVDFHLLGRHCITVSGVGHSEHLIRTVYCFALAAISTGGSDLNEFAVK